MSIEEWYFLLPSESFVLLSGCPSSLWTRDMSDSLQLKTQFFNYGDDDGCHIENSSGGQRFKKHALIQDLVCIKNQRIFNRKSQKKNPHCQLQELNRNKIQNFSTANPELKRPGGLPLKLLLYWVVWVLSNYDRWTQGREDNEKQRWKQ